MSLARAVAKNVLYKGAGEVVVRLLAFAFVVLVARTLPEAEFGVLNFAYAFPLLFVVLVDFGFAPLLIREASRGPQDRARVFYNLLLLKLAFAAVYLLAVAAGLAWFAPGPAFRRAGVFLAVFVLCNSFTEFVNALFQSGQRMELEATVNAWQKLALLLLGLGALGLGWGLYGVAGAYAAAGVLGLTAGVLVLRRAGLASGAWRPDPAWWGWALRQALPLTLATLFINLYFRIDMTLLARLRPAAEVGWYGAAHKSIEVLMVVPAVLVAASFPGLSRLFVEDREKLLRGARQLLRLLILLAVPLAAGAAVLHTPLMVLLFGEAYRPAGPALAWLSLALAFIFLNYALSYLLISGERQRVNAAAAGAAVAVAVGANLWLIPRHGHVGAAMAAAVTEGFLLLAYGAAVRRLLFPLRLGATLWKAPLAAGCMLPVVWWLRGAQPLLAVAAGAGAYAAALWLLRALGPEELGLLRRVLARRPDA